MSYEKQTKVALASTNMALKKEILDEIIFESFPATEKTGGQTCGMTPTGVKLICQAARFEVSVNNYRSQIKNKELALLLFELYLQEVGC
jgi:protein subunit release factor B